MIAISLQEDPLTTSEEVSHLIQRKYAAAQYIIRSTVYSRLHNSPGDMVFGTRNMLHPFSSQINWDDLINHRQDFMEQSNLREDMPS